MSLLSLNAQHTINLCITFIERRPRAFDVVPTLHKCNTEVLCLFCICDDLSIILYNSSDPCHTKFICLNLQPLEVVSRYSDPQPQVVENHAYLFDLRRNICKY